MNISNSEIRTKARQALGKSIFDHNWLMALVCVLIPNLIIGVVSYMSCGIGAFLLAGALNVGLCGVLLRFIRRENQLEVGRIFDGLNDFGSNLMVGLMVSILTALWSLLFIIPGIVKSYAYSMAYFVKADHPEYDWRQCINESERMMQGNKWKLFCLNMSFIGWAIVGSLACGIGTLWVNAYMQTSYAIFYDELKKEQGYSTVY